MCLLILGVLMSTLIKLCSSVQPGFPDDFKFGAASSAYQTEGAWNVDGKGESVWDHFSHTYPEKITDHSNGDVAGNSYYLWERDVEIAKELGLKCYRFSISWTRVLPNGFINNINEKGVAYYNKLIDALIAAGIEPIITMVHFDIPYEIDVLGGFTNANFINWFLDYSKVLFSLYADRVKYWLTFNEAYIFCETYFKSNFTQPLMIDNEYRPYICSKNVMLAHAVTYRYYQKEYKEKYNGLISLSNLARWMEAADEDNEHEQAMAEFIRQYIMGRYFHPIYSNAGGWPPSVEKALSEIAQISNKSALPTFTEAEKQLVRGSADYIGINYYAGAKVRLASSNYTYDFEVDVTLESDMEGAYDTRWLSHNIYPIGLRKSVLWLTEQYGRWSIMITENGYGGLDRDLNDYTRIMVIRDTLEQVLLSIHEDHIHYIGYNYWSMIDVFSLDNGYTVKFGLWDVDFDDPARPRASRRSARYYTCVILNKGLEACEHLINKNFC